MNPAEKVIDALTCAAASIDKLEKAAADKKASEDKYTAKIPSIVEKCVQFGRIDSTEREKLAEWLATPEGALEVIDKLAEHKVEEKTAESLGAEVDVNGRPANGKVKKASDGPTYLGGRRTSEEPESWRRMAAGLGM